MAINAVIRFLQAARSMAKQGMKKEQILDFARREFGEVSKLLRKQIDDIFKAKPKTEKKGDVVPIKKKVDLSKYDDEALNRLVDEDIMLRGEADTLSDFGKDYGRVKEIEKRRKEIKEILEAAQKNPELVGGAKEGIMATDEAADIKKVIDEKEGDDFIDFIRKQGDEEGANKVQKEVDRLNKAIEDADKRVAAKEALEKRTADIKKGDVEGTGVESLGTSMNRLKKKVDELKKISQDTLPGDIMKEIMKGQKVMAENYKTGNIRTAVRWFMRQEADAGRLKLRKWDDEALKVYGQTTESDPINIFRRYYGEGALEAVDEIGDVFRQGESFNHYAELLRKNVDSKILTPKTKGLGEYDPGVLTPKQENELRRQLLKEQEQKQILEEFDPTDRTKNADGGLIDILKL